MEVLRPPKLDCLQALLAKYRLRERFQAEVTQRSYVRRLAACAVVAGFVFAFPSVGRADNPIVLENQDPGTTTWQLTRPGYLTADDVSQQIKGYASATSVNKGSALTFYVTENPGQSFGIDIYRMGWYGGAGGRLMTHIGPVNGVRQPTCPSDATTGMMECQWSPAFTLTIPTTWTTGMYLALLTNAANYQNYVPFVVRDDSRVADLLYQSAATTWQAYNNYPRDGVTGKSLYDFNSYGANTVASTP